MASAGQIHAAIATAARQEMGRPLPASVTVAIKGNRVELVGPPGTGKSRISRAIKRTLGGNLRVFTGNRHDTLEEE
jgi:Holliday junction resolvasome RuvABC ATP-dependent DNA helicase subunit